jgi:hypothetical protein
MKPTTNHERPLEINRVNEKPLELLEISRIHQNSL